MANEKLRDALDKLYQCGGVAQACFESGQVPTLNDYDGQKKIDIDEAVKSIEELYKDYVSKEEHDVLLNVLDAIEEYCHLSDNETYLINPERYEPRLVDMAESISDIYTLAHGNNPRHECKHESWKFSNIYITKEEVKSKLVDYFTKICWSEKDIEYLLRAFGVNSEDDKKDDDIEPMYHITTKEQEAEDMADNY